MLHKMHCLLPQRLRKPHHRHSHNPLILWSSWSQCIIHYWNQICHTTIYPRITFSHTFPNAFYNSLNTLFHTFPSHLHLFGYISCITQFQNKTIPTKHANRPPWLGIVREYTMMTLESRPSRMCGANLGLLLGFVTSKWLWVVVHVLLMLSSKNRGTMIISKPWPQIFNINIWRSAHDYTWVNFKLLKYKLWTFSKALTISWSWHFAVE